MLKRVLVFRGVPFPVSCENEDPGSPFPGRIGTWVSIFPRDPCPHIIGRIGTQDPYFFGNVGIPLWKWERLNPLCGWLFSQEYGDHLYYGWPFLCCRPLMTSLLSLMTWPFLYHGYRTVYNSEGVLSKALAMYRYRLNIHIHNLQDWPKHLSVVWWRVLVSGKYRRNY